MRITFGKCLAGTIVGTSLLAGSPVAQERTQAQDVQVGHLQAVERRLAQASAPTAARRDTPYGLMTPLERRYSIDSYWGDGEPTEVKLQVFDRFWQYVDAKFAAFQELRVDWAALRERYRPEIALGVSRGRFAAIINHMSLRLRESHTRPVDLDVNVFTVPQRGIPLLAVGAWIFDPSGACFTAMDDGSALVYSAYSKHPLGLEPGDRILGYDGKPWRDLYRELIAEELPLYPLWWGSSPSSFDHSFVMAAGQNWPLFQTMDIAKRSGVIVHMPTSLMPDFPLWWGFCAEQMDIAGVPKPEGTVSWGIVEGTRIGYIYVYSWTDDSADRFEEAVVDLTQVQLVDGLIVDFRFNGGGNVDASRRGLGALFRHPVNTLALDQRKNETDHLKMEKFEGPSFFRLDLDPDTGERIKGSFAGPIAVLVGPGALSAADLRSYWLSLHPRARTFGKSTSAAFNLPTQSFLGTSLDLGPTWEARIAEANFRAVGDPKGHYLTRREFDVDHPVWLRPEDVAAGKDSVVEAAMSWLATQLASSRSR